MNFFLTILAGISILALSPAAFAGWDKSATDRIEHLQAARQKAQLNGEAIAKAAAILSDYNRSNSQYNNGLPVTVNEVKVIIEKNDSFRNDELNEISERLKEFYKAYSVSSLKDLESKIGERLNPREWTGIQSPMPFSAYQYQQNLESFESFEKEAKTAMIGALANEKDEAARSVIIITNFPQHNYSGGDLSQLQNEIKNALISPKVKHDDLLNIAITSDWSAGVFPITKIPFRTIGASVLFVDKDSDGNCRFNAYRFISVDGAELEYKSVKAGLGEGYAKCDQAITANGGIKASNSGFFSSLIWFLLVVVNLIGGALILKDKSFSVKRIRPFLVILDKNQSVFGLVALGLGLLSLLMSFLSSSIFQNFIPQASAVIIGIVLSSQFSISKRQKMVIAISESKLFTQPIGIIAVVVAVIHLVFSGDLYFI